eukprot:TRINITY_DN2667_c0_g1_i11.p1 TRINITY_DN2667_c0_g1~~TRINITY_DN2667_c0_g1_i11.p1  ORF type:complete len:433 (-),score=85.56 TRINITY_DN2667_c0_g1_i11:324-1544(-)
MSRASEESRQFQNLVRTEQEKSQRVEAGMQQMRQHLENKEKEFQGVQNQLKQVSMQKQQSEQKVVELTQAQQGHNDHVHQLQMKISSMETETTELRAQLERFQDASQQLYAWDGQMSDQQQQVNELRQENETLKENLQSARTAAERSQQEVAQLSTDVQQMTATIGNLNRENVQLRSGQNPGSDQVQRQVQSLQQERDGLLKKLEEAKQGGIQKLQNQEQQQASEELVAERNALKKKLAEYENTFQGIDVPNDTKRVIQFFRHRSAELDTELNNLKGEYTVAKKELGIQRKRAEDAESMYQQLYGHMRQQQIDERQNRAGSGTLNNKKDEDDMYDVEAAMLSGGGMTGFKPLLQRSNRLCSNRAIAYSAKQLDKAYIGLYSKPTARALIFMYFIMLHFGMIGSLVV